MQNDKIFEIISVIKNYNFFVSFSEPEKSLDNLKIYHVKLLPKFTPSVKICFDWQFFRVLEQA